MSGRAVSFAVSDDDDDDRDFPTCIICGEMICGFVNPFQIDCGREECAGEVNRIDAVPMGTCGGCGSYGELDKTCTRRNPEGRMEECGQYV